MMGIFDRAVEAISQGQAAFLLGISLGLFVGATVNSVITAIMDARLRRNSH